MNTQQTKLGLALKEAGVPLSVESFDDRLILQKAVYLLQQAQIHLGYRFRWYLKGPYSTDLTEDVFALAHLEDKGASELAQWEMDMDSRKRIEKIRGWFSPLKGNALAKKLELLASVLFLIVTQQVSALDSARISVVLKENGKTFEPNEVADAVSDLRAHGYQI